MTDQDGAIAELLRANCTTRQIRELLGTDFSTIARVRRERGLPVTTWRPPPVRTVDEALALYAEQHGDGHVRWTGPVRGRSSVFEAEGVRHSAREVIFRRHYRRAPLGYIRTTCTVSGCIAGPHLADLIARTTTPGDDRTTAIERLIALGASDWQIVCHLGTTVSAISRIRAHLTTPASDRSDS